MIGMNRHTGRAITTAPDHIRQSVETILSTPIGSRVERREFGSLLPALIDTPANDTNVLRAYSAAVIAIMTWEPRITISRIIRSVDTATPGRVLFDIESVTADGEYLQFSVSPDPSNVASISPDRLSAVIDGEYQLQRMTEQERPDDLGGLT